MQPSFPDSVLSPAVNAALDRIVRHRGGAGDVTAVMAALGELPLRHFDSAARELGWRFGRYAPAPPRPPWYAFWRRSAVVPAWFRLSHHSGYIREAALRALKGPAPGAFFVVALAYRLNDWVPQVRAAAVEALRRKPLHRARDPRPGDALSAPAQPGLVALGRGDAAARRPAGQ